MNARLLLVTGGLAGLAAWWALRRPESGELDFTALGAVGATDDLLGRIVDSMGYLGMVRVSAMKGLSAEVLANRNVRAMLAVIRRGEGTAGDEGYRMLFGGKLFGGFADHPRQSVCRNTSNGKRLCSTAAGAYQFLASTWDETARAMRLTGFSPANQDFAAVGRIAARGALADVLAGRFDAAVAKLAREWASLPGSPYGQPVISSAVARSVYVAAGGTIQGVVIA